MPFGTGTIDSNVAGLRIALETPNQIKVLPGTPVWDIYEPNEIPTLGGEVVTVARNPINPSRQRKPGFVTDLNSDWQFGTDVTLKNIEKLMQAFFLANLRNKVQSPDTGAGSITGVAGAATNQYQAASGLTIFKVGDLVAGEFFTAAANNGLHRVTAVAGTTVTVAENLVTEASPPAGARLVQVGFQFGSGEVDIDVSGALPRLVRVSGTKAMTDFGLIPGEYVFIGGDAANTFFGTAANNGYARVRSVAATFIEFDYTYTTMANETGTGKTIQIFFGRVLKNEQPAQIVYQSVQPEFTLGDPGSGTQAIYQPGSVGNEMTFNIPTAGKVTADFGFLSLDAESVLSGASLKSGTRPALVERPAYNTSSDVSRIKLGQYGTGTATNVSSLLGFLGDLKLKISNGAVVNKAIGTLGGIGVTVGDFVVTLEMEAYFYDLAAVAAVRSNADLTVSAHLVKNNSGISFDVPLVKLGNARPNIVKDQPIKLPLTSEAPTASQISAVLDHTLMMIFWTYLPNRADI